MTELFPPSASLRDEIDRCHRPNVEKRQAQSILVHEPGRRMLQLHLVRGHATQLLLQHFLQILDRGRGLGGDVDGLAVEVPMGAGRVVRNADAYRNVVGIRQGGDEIGFGEQFVLLRGGQQRRRLRRIRTRRGRHAGDDGYARWWRWGWSRGEVRIDFRFVNFRPLCWWFLRGNGGLCRNHLFLEGGGPGAAAPRRAEPPTQVVREVAAEAAAWPDHE